MLVHWGASVGADDGDAPGRDGRSRDDAGDGWGPRRRRPGGVRARTRLRLPRAARAQRTPRRRTSVGAAVRRRIGRPRTRAASRRVRRRGGSPAIGDPRRHAPWRRHQRRRRTGQRGRRRLLARRPGDHPGVAAPRRRADDVPRALVPRVPPAPATVRRRAVPRREPARPYVAREPTAAVGRHGRLRRAGRRGVGRPPGVERQLAGARGTPTRRAGDGPARRAAASRRGHAAARRALRDAAGVRRPLDDRTRSRPAGSSTPSCARRRRTATGRDPSC